MSAFWIQFVTILCLHGACAGIAGVVRKTAGEDITIQCKCSESPTYLSLKKGLHQEDEVFFKEKEYKNHTVARSVTGRLQIHGAFPNIDILIKNLTLQDTGPYWCLYSVYSTNTFSVQSVKGTGSVLLVVTEPKQPTKAEAQCPGVVQQDGILLAVVITAAVLLGITMAVLIWIYKIKQSRFTVKPRQGTTNDVYEDMRGTLRR
ncbi:uncharacterized protein LOC114440196 [Parambassis ranga]|uniref:Uncharacterized protein LOC114440196 n=1 Tax=Parambassis ranga TaxID=210632 RepID=A0A6P7IJD9_9TELE|nr:uncharacterized protein LOC114440196 [Parambassis ranga]